MPSALGVSLRRQLEQDDIVCPAGEALGGSCVFCAVEQTVIDGFLNPHPVSAFCLGDNQECPSWRKEKDAIAAGYKGAIDMVLAKTPQPKRYRKRAEEFAEERGIKLERRTEVALEDRAQELLYGNSEEALRFRRRTGLDRPQA